MCLDHKPQHNNMQEEQWKQLSTNSTDQQLTQKTSNKFNFTTELELADKSLKTY